MKPTRILPADPVYDLSKHVAYVQKLHEAYPLNTYAKCMDRAKALLREITNNKLPHQILGETGEGLFKLLMHDGCFVIAPPDTEDRDYLTRMQALLTTTEWPDVAQRAAVKLYQLIYSQLPQSIYEEKTSGFSVPIYSLIPDLPALILHIQHQSKATHNGLTIFDGLNNRLYWNTIKASGFDLATYDDNPKPLTLPTDSDLPPDQLIRAYLGGTPFEQLFTVSVPFHIPFSVRNEHFLMIARTGSGKTQYIQRDILENLQRPDGPGMVVIDSQNQMIPKLERLQAARDRMVIIDPFDTATDGTPCAPALNMFISPKPPITDPNLKEAIEANTLQQFAWIFSALDQELTGRQTTLFTFTARILLEMKANMQTLLEFMRIEKSAELKASKFWPYIEASDEQTRYFFDNRFCTNDYNKTKGGVADRLLGVLRVPAFNRMFMAHANKLDLYSELAQRKLIVFNTHKSRLGNDASAILGRYAISLYIRAALERELDRNPSPAFLYVDEASEYFGKKDSSDTLFTQLRKYNCGTFVAFQDLSQLGEQQHTLIANTATKLTGGLSVADARKLAPDMGTSEQELMNIHKAAGAFELMCYVNNLTPRAIKLRFDYGAVENAPQLDEASHTSLREVNRQRLSAHAADKLVAAPTEVRPPEINSTEPPRPTAAHSDPQIKPGKDW